MADTGAVTAAQAAAAGSGITFAPRPATAGWFAEWAAERSTALVPSGADAVLRTTLDPRVQAVAEARLAAVLDGPGAAAGAGFGLALACDVRLVSDAATLTAGYARRGLSPDAGVTYFLPRLVGLSRAADVILRSPECARFFRGPQLQWAGNEVPVSADGEVLRIDRLVRLDDAGRPATFDPCWPVRWVLRPDGAPEGGDRLVHEAVAQVARATGLRFVFSGQTDEAPSPDRATALPERYGTGPAPVLVAWETEEQNPALVGDTVGQAGSVSVSLGEGTRVFVSGTVSLDAGRMPEILSMRDGAETARAIILHELGHLVGLAHVDDPTQLMYPEARREVPDFGPGDLTGLEVLGSGPCLPEL